MSRFIAGGSLNLPHNAHQQYMKEKREILATGIKLSESEIFEKLSEVSQAMEVALHRVARFSATDSGTGETKDLEVEQETFHSPEDETIQTETSRLLHDAINELPERERSVILHMAGLDETVDPMTLREIGAVMNLSHERIRQIRDKALSRLKSRLGCKLSELLSE
jgi:RNA polymerase primary sigma factor